MNLYRKIAADCEQGVVDKVDKVLYMDKDFLKHTFNKLWIYAHIGAFCMREESTFCFCQTSVK